LSMSNLHSTLPSALITRYSANAARIHELAVPLTDSQFWQRPFPFGNSFGHLVLHLTGNLNYYIGAQIAKTGYIRDRLKEFRDPEPRPKAEVLKCFDETIAIVMKTIGGQSADDWSAQYSGVGTDAKNRLDIFMICAGHMQLHIGQMIYLTYELGRQHETASR
jgi:hypothetical protein